MVNINRAVVKTLIGPGGGGGEGGVYFDQVLRDKIFGIKWQVLSNLSVRNISYEFNA